MIIFAPAKVNLALKILSKDKKDGFHYLESVFDPVSLYDIIEIREKKGPGIIVKDVYGKLKIQAKDNIVYRAAVLLKEEYGIKKGAIIKIYKHIPDGAGLGGGSSDAAATLKGLAGLWGVKTGRAGLKKLCVKLGSDVSFFIGAKPAVVSGKGEKIEIIKRKRKLWYVIVCPAGKVSTKKAYEWYDKSPDRGGGRGNVKKLKKMLENTKSLEKQRNIMYNSFERIVSGRIKNIALIKKKLSLCQSAEVSLSGSGSAVFALFETKDKALECYRKMNKKKKSYFVCLVHSI